MKKFIIMFFITSAIANAAFGFIKFQNNKKNEEKIPLNKENLPMKSYVKYEVKEELKPTNLNGISNEQIDDHWKLYQGYVKQVNNLNEELIELTKSDKGSSLIYADRRRRYGFEYNGMILHEKYFENLTNKEESLKDEKLKKAIEEKWDSLENFLLDFSNTGKTRGIGWAILYADPNTKQLTNHFISEHQNGTISTFVPILVMDVWEHAYMIDHKSGGRADYINSFIKNIAWTVAEKRFQEIQS